MKDFEPAVAQQLAPGLKSLVLAGLMGMREKNVGLAASQLQHFLNSYARHLVSAKVRGRSAGKNPSVPPRVGGRGAGGQGQGVPDPNADMNFEDALGDMIDRGGLFSG